MVERNKLPENAAAADQMTILGGFLAFTCVGAMLILLFGGRLWQASEPIASEPSEEAPARTQHQRQPLDVGELSRRDLAIDAPPVQDPLPINLITKGKYEALRTGMTYRQAVEILGEEGEEVAFSHIGQGTAHAVITRMYVWSNADGSNLNVTFQNSRLTQKAQFGLK